LSEPFLPLALVVLLLALGLGAFQVLPLSSDVHEALSPQSARLWRELLPQQSGEGTSRADRGTSRAVPNRPLVSHTALENDLGVPTTPRHHTLSLYPASTRRDLALLVLATSVFVLGGVLFRSAGATAWILSILAVNGAAFAFFGLVQQLTWNGRLYWSIPLTHGGTPFGAFVNRNSAGGYLNLCLAAAIGLTVWTLARREVSAVGRSITGHVLAFLANLNGRTLTGFLLAACMVAGILSSLSRGAWLAMVVAATLTLLCVSLTRHFQARFTWVVIVAVLGLGVAGWVGRTDAIRSRLSTLLSYEQNVSNERLAHWQDGIRSANDFLVFGSGLGTYRYVYRLYQQNRLGEEWFYHAENQYVEALLDAGVVGVGLILVMVGLIGVASWRLLQEPPYTADYALGIAGAFGLVSQVVHATFDFGLYMPANMIAFALLCGVVAGRAAQLEARRDRTELTGVAWMASRILWLPVTRHLSASLLALLAVLVWWGYGEAQDLAAIERAMDHTRIAEDASKKPAEEWSKSIQELTASVEGCPDDAQAQFRLAQLWINLYRSEKVQKLREGRGLQVNEVALWDSTSTAILHGRAHDLAATRRNADLDSMRSEPPAGKCLAPALQHLLLARRACPVLADVHLRIAELSFMAGDPAGDWIHLERARQLAPSSASVLFYIGLLEIQAGRSDMACVSWRKSLEISPGNLESILTHAAKYLDLPKQIGDLLPDSPAVLIQTARVHFQDAAHAGTRQAILKKAEALMARTELPKDEACYLRGTILAARKQNLQAIRYVSQAVELRPDNTAWRFELATLLRDRGMVQESQNQAKLCLQREPGNPQYQQLLRELIRTQLTNGRNARPQESLQ
jgi:O-antigen ligase/Flp pilus assembly protein TadD